MAVFKFRVFWEEDDNIFRDILLLNGQSFLMFHEAILAAFDFDKKHSANFYQSNEHWKLGRAISSEVLVNKKDAPALSMLKTPVSALINHPDERFVYVYDPAKNWTFLIELIGIDKEEQLTNLSYPACVRKEGIAPMQMGYKGLANERLLEVEEKYDLQQEDLDEGFGREGEEDTSQQEDI